jgi:hypothetical protein
MFHKIIKINQSNMNKSKLFDNDDIIFEKSFLLGESLPPKLSSFEIWVIAAIACAPVAVLIFSLLIVSVFQAKKALGSWNLVWKVYMKKIGLSSATSSPP